MKKNLKISAELASVVLDKEVTECSLVNTARSSINITYFEDKEDFNTVWKEWNIYEFAFKNLKQWAKLKNVFDKIDWSEEPEQIFKKAEKLKNEIN